MSSGFSSLTFSLRKRLKSKGETQRIECLIVLYINCTYLLTQMISKKMRKSCFIHTCISIRCDSESSRPPSKPKLVQQTIHKRTRRNRLGLRGDWYGLGRRRAHVPAIHRHRPLGHWVGTRRAIKRVLGVRIRVRMWRRTTAGLGP